MFALVQQPQMLHAISNIRTMVLQIASTTLHFKQAVESTTPKCTKC